MKRFPIATFLVAALCTATANAQTQPAPRGVAGRPVRLNSVGFLPDAAKRATVAGDAPHDFAVRRAGDDAIVFRGSLGDAVRTAATETDESVRVAAFDTLREPGRYVLDVDGVGRSAPFDVGPDVWNRPMYATLRGFTLWRCGTAVDATWDGVTYRHDACHLDDAWLDHVGGGHVHRDATGGWHDAGDFNKYIVNAGFALGMMFKAWEQNPAALTSANFDLPKTAGAMPDFLAEAKWETDWFLKMQSDDGRAYSKVSQLGFKYWGPPDGDVEPRYFVGWSTPATAHLTAALAMASRHFRPFDAAYADRCLAAARLGAAALAATPQMVPADQQDFSTGTYAVDDASLRLWAAAEMWAATGEASFLADFETRAPAFHVSAFGPSYSDAQDLAFDTYLASDSAARGGALVARLRGEVVAQADEIVKRADANAYGRPLGGEKGQWWWGANGQVAASTFLLNLADRVQPDPRYRAASLDALAFLFGRNYFARSFVTGIGDAPPQHPHDRRTGTGAAWPGYLVGGGWPTGANWVDVQDDYRQNEIALNWNAALVYAIAPFAPAPTSRPSAEAGAMTVASRTIAGLLAMAAIAHAGSPTTQPSDKNARGRPVAAIKCAARVGAAIGRPCDVIFLGDSITQNFAEAPDGRWSLIDDVVLPPIPDEPPSDLCGLDVWQRHYAGRHVLNLGVGSDGTEHALWRLDHLPIAGLAPKVVVVCIGTNDTARPPADVAAGVGAVVARVRTIFAQARVILVSIPPNARATQATADANVLIAKLADNDVVCFFDLAARMVPQGDNWRGVGHDRLHLSPDGYELWASQMEPLLTRLLKLPPAATTQP